MMNAGKMSRATDEPLAGKESALSDVSFRTESTCDEDFSSSWSESSPNLSVDAMQQITESYKIERRTGASCDLLSLLASSSSSLPFCQKQNLSKVCSTNITGEVNSRHFLGRALASLDFMDVDPSICSESSPDDDISSSSSSLWSDHSLDRLDDLASPLTVRSTSSGVEQTSNRPRVIRFAPKPEVYFVPSLSNYTPEEVGRCWYTSSECIKRQRAAKALIKRVIGGSHVASMLSCGHAVRQTLFQMQSVSCRIASSSQRAEDFVGNSSCRESIESPLMLYEAHADFIAWTTQANGLRGLERYVAEAVFPASSKIGRLRRELASSSRRLVVDMQDRERDATRLAAQYAEFSRTSVVYSQMMAVADHHAARARKTPQGASHSAKEAKLA
jgi:hypothetical protein